MDKLKILLTNDDGYDSLGIKLVYDLLKERADITVFAPKTHQSGKGVAIDIRKPLTLERVSENVFTIDSTPADVVAFALTNFKEKKFDLVISGVNHGYNLAHDTLHSGTIGASIQSLILGVPSIALSAHFSLVNVKEHLLEVFDFIMKNNLISKDYLLSVNFPSSEVKGIKITKLSKMIEEPIYEVKDHKFYRGRMSKFIETKDDEKTAIKNGFIAITPLKPTFFDEILFDKIKKKIKK